MRPHNPATGFWPSSTTVVSTLYWTVFTWNKDTAVSVEGNGDLQTLVSLLRDPDDVAHCRILSSDKAEWRLILAALCRWRCCFLADQLHGSWHAHEKNCGKSNMINYCMLWVLAADNVVWLQCCVWQSCDVACDHIQMLSSFCIVPAFMKII